MGFYFNIVLFITVFSKTQHAKGEKYITVWESPNSRGASENLCVSHCSNLRHPNTIKLGSDINLQGNCARVYDDFNCTGESTELLPGYPSLNDFTQWNMDNRISSVGPCRNECAIDVTGKYNGEEDIKVQLFNQANYKGSDGILIGTGCLSVPSSFIEHVKSIKTFGQCIQLYNNSNCLNSGSTMQSVELRPETYFHSDFSKWKFPKVQSISHCRYKCDEGLRQKKTSDVTMFDRINNAGNWLRVKIDKCTHLPYQWEVAAKSMELADVTCAEIYEGFACHGEPFIVKSNNANLMATRGNLPIRSIRFCEEPIVDSSSKNTFPYFYVLVPLFLVILLVGVFFLGKGYAFVKETAVSPAGENDAAQYVKGDDMEGKLPEHCKKVEKSLLTF